MAAVVLKGKPLNYNAAVQTRYVLALEDMTRRMTVEWEREITALFRTPDAQQFFTQDASIASQARILTNALAEKFDALFRGNARPLASAMVNQSERASVTAVRESLREVAKDLAFKASIVTDPMRDVMTATVAENVSLIKSISSQYLHDVRAGVMRSISQGNGLQDLTPLMQKLQGQTLRRARNIALDQTRKAYNSINKGRLLGLGVGEYEWLHSGGTVHPRELHQFGLNGNVYRFDKPPVIDETTGERGIPGQAINCHCRMVPVIRFGGDDERAAG